MADLHKYQTHEILNKIFNNAETAIQVDIVAGAEYAEDASHTSTDTGNFVLGVRNDTLGALGGADGDYVAFQMNADGALYVDVAAGGVLESAVDGLETLLTAANVDHAANEALLITIDADTNSIKGHVDGIETLITSTNSKIDTFDAVLDNILTKNTEIDAVLDTIKTDTGTIDSDTNDIKTDIAALEVLSTAANVDLAEIEVATEATQSALEKMLYGNALVVTAVHGGSTQALGATYESLYVGVGGDVVVTMVGTGNFTFKNLASGQLLPIRFTHVINTNTTATNMIALKA